MTAVPIPSSNNMYQQVFVINSLIPGNYDYVGLTYNGTASITQALFKTGGSAGIVVSTLIFEYDSSDNLISVTEL
jgi:hypothetical protein